ncbi:hypothetical protein E2C01_101446 [Portunus trituberculatus]|uniref:Uncharacterized protein n=1 Tax=Portunus trituberculatus TaxID=210409 RepID=A0A5B7KK39_PORTR|nr:hypothetical protein [Portunus trituberculatus]
MYFHSSPHRTTLLSFLPPLTPQHIHPHTHPHTLHHTLTPSALRRPPTPLTSKLAAPPWLIKASRAQPQDNPLRPRLPPPNPAQPRPALPYPALPVPIQTSNSSAPPILPLHFTTTTTTTIAP